MFLLANGIFLLGWILCCNIHNTKSPFINPRVAYWTSLVAIWLSAFLITFGIAKIIEDVVTETNARLIIATRYVDWNETKTLDTE